MSGAKRTVSFKAADKAGKNQIPTTIAPNAVDVAGGAGATDRTQATLENIAPFSRTDTDEQFPVDLSQSDPRDAEITAKLELSRAAGTPGITPFGRLMAKDSDFEWLRSKREAEAEGEFQQWFASNFDKMSPEQKKMAREIWPEFYQGRLQLLEKQINLQRRIARLKVEGIKDKDDLLLSYALHAGFIDSNPLENILHPERAASAQMAALREGMFVRGLFNPLRLPRGEWGILNRETNAEGVTGRLASAFGTNPAFNLGTTGGGGFSAIGPQTSATESSANFQTQFANL